MFDVVDINEQTLRRAYFMAAKRRKPKGKKTLPPAKVNPSLQAKYRLMLLQMTESFNDLILETLMPVVTHIDSEIKTNSATDELERAFKFLEGTLVYFQEKYDRNIMSLIDEYDNDSRVKFSKAIKKTIGIDVSTIISEGSIQDKLQAFTAENLNLIKSLPTDQLSNIKSMIYQQLSSGRFDRNLIRDKIYYEYGVTKRRADFIAIDQSHKMNATLNRIRNESIGANTYIWHNANNRRVTGNPSGIYPDAKPSHWDREGKVYSYDKPPEGGNPGERYRCQCYAEAILPEPIFK